MSKENITMLKIENWNEECATEIPTRPKSETKPTEDNEWVLYTARLFHTRRQNSACLKKCELFPWK